MYLGHISYTDVQSICDHFSDCFKSVFVEHSNPRLIPINSKNNVVNFLRVASIIIIQSCAHNFKKNDPINSAGSILNPSIFFVKYRNQLNGLFSLLAIQNIIAILPQHLEISTFYLLIIPIHKSGDKNIITNNRPISKLPIVSKDMENIVIVQYKQSYPKIITSFSENGQQR